MSGHGMVFLGFGKYVRADRIYALEPIVGDERGSGRRTLVWVEGIPDPVVASHIHVGAAGESGDVVVPLDVAGFEGSSEGCTEDADADVLQAIIDNPAGYYVNLHTEPFAGGAIRGQLAAANPNTALPTSDRTAVIVGMLVLALAAAMALRTWRPFATRD